MSIYTEWQNFKDEHVVTMLLNCDKAELDESFEDAEAADPERASRLRSALDAAHAALDNGQAAQDKEGWLLNGDFPFKVNVDGWFSLYDGEKIIASVPDDVEYPVGTEGTITVSIGVCGSVDAQLPKPDFEAAPKPYGLPEPPAGFDHDVEPAPEVDWRAIEESNIGILNAMFVRGAGSRQRSARVFADKSSILLKSSHDLSDSHPFKAEDVGMGTVEFTYNQWSPNQILIVSEANLDCEFVRDTIRKYLDSDWLDYPYRDRKRIDFTLRP